VLKRIDHVGMAVKNVDECVNFFQQVLNAKVGFRQSDEKNKVKVAFLEIGDGLVELLEGLDLTVGIGKFVAEHGEGPHHICFEVGNLEDSFSTIGKKGVELIDTKLKPGAYQKKIAFITKVNGTLIQFCEKIR